MKKFGLLILDAEPFPKMTAADAALFNAYVRAGGNLLVVTAEQGRSYAAEMAGLVPGMPPATGPLAPGRLEPAPGARFYRAVSLAADSTAAFGRWRSFQQTSAVYPVAPQAVTLLTCGQTPCLSVGFYGRGRVYLLGLTELFRLRQWGRARTVDRFLTSLLEDALLPTFPNAETSLATYPHTPVAGAPVHLLWSSALGGTGQCGIGQRTQPVSFTAQPETDISMAYTHVPAAGIMTISAPDGQQREIQVVTPISGEQMYIGLNQVYLKKLARKTNGVYVPLARLRVQAASLKARTARDVTFREVRLWNWPLFLLLIVALLVVEWTLRRKSGLVL